MDKQTEKRVCTCGAGYFCTFDCENCDAFKEPKEAEREREKYQDIKSSMCCMYCASYELRERVCLKTMQKVKMNGKPCKDFELGGMAAYYHGIETNEDYTYFCERYRKEQIND